MTASTAVPGSVASFDDAATPVTIPLEVHALRILGLRSGMRFLDVAPGRGTLSVSAARMGAEVVAADADHSVIERLKARALDEGLTNITARVMDGRSLEAEDQSFDATGSQHGITLLPDFPERLAELARVTRRAGRILVVTVGSPARAEHLGYVLGAVRAVVSGIANPPDPWPFPTTEPKALRSAFTHAGLRDVQVEPVSGGLRFRSGAHLDDFVSSTGPFGARLETRLTPGQRAAVREVLDGMLRRRSTDGRSAVLEIEIIIAVGTR